MEQVRIANARRNNIIMDDDDDDDDDDDNGDGGVNDDGDDNNMPNGNEHVLKENDNVENRHENRKAPRAGKDMDSGDTSKKQKLIETHIDSDGNEGNTITSPRRPTFQQHVLDHERTLYIIEYSDSREVGSHRTKETHLCTK